MPSPTEPQGPSRADEMRIPIVEERAVIGKRAVETGRVRVRTIVEAHHEIVRDALARENVEVTRVPIDRAVEAAPAMREEGDTTIIPIVEEVLVVEKRLMLREEIHIRRQTTVEPVEQEVTLRTTRAVVERDDDGQGAPHPASPHPERQE